MLFHGHLKRQGSPWAPFGSEKALLGALSLPVLRGHGGATLGAQGRLTKRFLHVPSTCFRADLSRWTKRDPSNFQSSLAEIQDDCCFLTVRLIPCLSEVTTLSPPALGPQGLSLEVCPINATSFLELSRFSQGS